MLKIPTWLVPGLRVVSSKLLNRPVWIGRTYEEDTKSSSKDELQFRFTRKSM